MRRRFLTCTAQVVRLIIFLGTASSSLLCLADPPHHGDWAELPLPEMVVQSGHASPVEAVSFSPDDKLLASGSGEAWSLEEANVVKLWDVATGAELRTLKHDRPITWVGFSTDGRQVAAIGEGGTGRLRVWEVSSGSQVAEIGAASDYKSRAITSDGKLIAKINGKEIELCDAQTGQRHHTLASRTSDFQKVMFSPDSAILATGGHRFSIRLWDLRSGVLRTLMGHTDYPIAADFSPDSRLFASGGHDLTVRIWDVASGLEIRALAGHTGQYVKGIHFSPDGKTLLSLDKAGFKLWDTTTWQQLASAAGDYENHDVCFNPEGSLLAAKVGGETVLWSTQTGQEVRRMPGWGRLRFSPDGTVLAADQLFEQVKLWDVASGKELAILRKTDSTARYRARFVKTVFSPDSRVFAAAEYDLRRKGPWLWRLFLLETATGKLLHTVEVDATNFDDPEGDLLFSADSREIMNIGNGTITAWDVHSGKQVRTLQRNEDSLADFREMWALAPQRYLDVQYCPFSADGAYHAAIGDDGEIQLQEPQTGRRIATLLGIDETDWLVATDEGFFDGSPEAWKRILWRFNNDTFSYAPLEVFFNVFYHPGLLQDVLAGKRPKAPNGKELSRIDRRQPLVKITQLNDAAAQHGAATDKRLVSLAIDIEENALEPAWPDHPASSGARDVRLFRNGSLVKVWRGDISDIEASGEGKLLPAASKNKGRRISLQVEVPLVAGVNEFTAYAFNDANVKSLDASLTITGAERLRREATLHLLAIGVNKHDYKPLNLRYAVADAHAFATEVERQQAALRDDARVDSRLLIDGEATKQNILAELAELSRCVQPEDAVIVYFAGHGTAQGDQFYLIPHDIGYAEDSPGIEDDGLPALLRRSISDRELEQAFERVDAAQILFVIDACNSGQALESDEKRRGPMNSKGLAQLAYEKGMYILTAAQSYQAAHEVSKLGHGLLTYALVEEGLRRSAANAGLRDDRIDVRELFDYATRRVPQLHLHELEMTTSQGTRLANTETASAVQRPRMFYRSDDGTKPMVLAIADAPVMTVPPIEPVEPHVGEERPAFLLSPSDIEGVKQRGLLGVFRKGPAEDLKVDIVEEQSGVYHTANRTQAILGTYGKVIEGNRLMGRLPKFEHRGLLQRIEHVRRFATVQRRGQSTGSDFLSLMGSRQAWQIFNLGGKVSGGRENEVAYEIVGIRLDQTDVIKALNADADALAYFEYLSSKEELPCVVLENLVFTNYAASQETNLRSAATAQMAVTSDNANAQMQRQRESSTEFTSPVIRGYQMYGVKLHQHRVVELVTLEP